MSQAIAGIITKGIGGFYYIQTDIGLIECHARGKFRKMDIVPTVGDRVEITLSPTEEGIGSIEKILPRKNFFIRPPVSNIDNFIITFAAASPEPNLRLIDKLTAVAVKSSVNCVICINKTDISPTGAKELYDIYKAAGFDVILSCAKTGEGIDELKSFLQDKTSVFAGNSGVGKSSVINLIDASLKLKTGDVSKKISRGRHTTRHSELFALDFGGYVLDTPGFSSFDFTGIKKEELYMLFPEIAKNAYGCRFVGCSHISEPDCSVKAALYNLKIPQSRYESYKALYKQLCDEEENKYN